MADIEALLEDNTTNITDVRKQLINSDIMTDVTFLIGQTQFRKRAHKLFLASSSIVFFKMFCGPFEAQTTITISDIEPDCFRELLNHIYGHDVQLTMENVFDIWYGAEKYMLNELKELCRKYVLENTNSSNALAVFYKNQLLDNADINNLCIEEIGESPYEFFEDPSFLELPAEAFSKVMKTNKVNCSSDDLKQITIKWLNNHTSHGFADLNEQAYAVLAEMGIEQSDFTKKQFNYSLDLNPFGLFHLTKVASQVLRLNMSARCMRAVQSLHGVGIFLGVKIESNGPNNRELMKLTIEQNGAVHCHKELEIFQTNSLTIMQVMFKKLVLGEGEVFIKIDFGKISQRWTSHNMICTNVCNSRKGAPRPHECNKSALISKSTQTHSLIAYLIEKKSMHEVKFVTVSESDSDTDD
jgi:hypothetical protein